MAWKKLTFILIPHSQSTIKQVGMPRTVIYGIMVFLVAAVGVMIFYIMGFKGKSFYAGRTQQIMAENAALEKSLAGFDSSLTVVKARVAELDSINEQVLKESGISDRDLKTDDGIGGADSRSKLRLSTGRMLQIIDRLDRQSRAFDQRYGAMYQVCVKNSDYLRHVPSIRPAEGPILKEFGLSTDEVSGGDERNEGVNINNVEGTPVVATADGTVSQTQLNATDENGIFVVIDHGNGYETTYTHLRPDVLIHEGEKVKRGQRIGSIGRTGIMIVQVAPHILYKVKHHGTLVDPRRYFFASEEFSSKTAGNISPAQTPSRRPSS